MKQYKCDICKEVRDPLLMAVKDNNIDMIFQNDDRIVFIHTRDVAMHSHDRPMQLPKDVRDICMKCFAEMILEALEKAGE